MLSQIRKLLYFLSFLLIYLIGKEMIQLYLSLKSVHPYLGFSFLLISFAALSYYALLPAWKILSMPTSPSPLRSEENLQEELDKRFSLLRQNPYLNNINFDFSSIPDSLEGYETVTSTLKKESIRIRARYVNGLFYSSAISQNGFIDAILIFSASINLIRDTFILYNGRVSNRDLWTIGRQVYYSMAIGGSETVEYATGEIFSKLSTDSMKSIPFFDRILGSLADGYVNACLLTRVAIITDNYCRVIIAENDRLLRPSPTFVVQTAANITADLQKKIIDEVKAQAGNTVKSAAQWAFNPLSVILQKLKPDTSV